MMMFSVTTNHDHDDDHDVCIIFGYIYWCQGWQTKCFKDSFSKGSSEEKDKFSY